MITTSTLLLLCIAAFVAGFVDAVAGGGGLIQTPAGLVLLPQFPVAHVIGSLKIPAFSGTSFAAAQYVRRVKINV
ncbi:MAG: TSUP family transporter, partial [Chitinophagaceae bacterium]|nr:TSUP family transporter [Chitinophagaceae bacterium]